MDTINYLDLLTGYIEWEVGSFMDMSDRLDVLEALWDGPGPAYLDEGHCILAASDAGGPLPTLQHQTTVRHMARFDSLPTQYSVYAVQSDPESSEILTFTRPTMKDPST